MTARKVDLKALARLAIFARLCCTTCHRRETWTGLDADEWTRLSELASAVDRKTVLRFLSIEMLLIGCSSIVGAVLLVAFLLFSWRLVSWPAHITIVTTVIAVVAIPVVIAQSLIAADVAARRRLIKALTAKDGDAELVVKMRRQCLWVFGAASAVTVLMVFMLGMFRASLQPFFEQWWFLYLFAALVFVDFVWTLWRSPPGQPRGSDSTSWRR
jgi:hypothetical protein